MVTMIFNKCMYIIVITKHRYRYLTLQLLKGNLSCYNYCFSKNASTNISDAEHSASVTKHVQHHSVHSLIMLTKL